MLEKISFSKSALLTAGAMLAVLALGPYANANTIRINFSANAGSGYADLTVEHDRAASSNYDPLVPNPTGQPGQWDPEGAQLITGASGMFNGMAITGVKERNFANPPPPETLPKSYSTIGPPVDFLASYDNLFYVNGSPVVCPPGTGNPDGYPFSGGFLDIYGVMFELDNSDLVGLWSDGVVPPGGLTYGLSVFTPTDDGYEISSTQFAGARASVPEPGFAWLFGAAMLGLLAWRRSRA